MLPNGGCHMTHKDILDEAFPQYTQADRDWET